MTQRLDWPRYTRWTWILALLAIIALIWLWATGRGPGAGSSCCGAPVAVTAPADTGAATAAVSATAASAASVTAAAWLHKASWDGTKLTLEGAVPDEATKKAILSAAAAKYGAGNIVDKLTIDPAAKGPFKLSLTGEAPSEAVKTARGADLQSFYPAAMGVTVDNQLTISAAPAAKAEDVQCGSKVAVAATFASGSAKLTPDAVKLLGAVVPCITGPFEVGGHTDNVGQPAANQALSQRRAAAVAAFLVGKGVDAKLLSSKGYGESAPIGDNATAEGKAKNRRIEFKKM